MELTYVESIILGLVQGVAEFLPISSSGHLALIQNFFQMRSPEETSMFFDVLLHLGTLLAVCVVYWRDILDMIREFFLGVAALCSRKRRGGPVPPARRLVLMIILATLPLAAVLLVKDKVEALSSNTIFIGCALLVTGCLLFSSDRMARGRKTERTATMKDALLVGVAQALAVVPGLSRSGTTISAGMFLGFDRPFAVRFSFLMSLPAVLGANILSLADAAQEGVAPDMIPVYAVGVAVAAVSGYFAIRLIKLLADKGRFGAFAYYCWAVGIVSIVASLILR